MTFTSAQSASTSGTEPSVVAYLRSTGETIWSLMARDAWIQYSWLRWTLPFEAANVVAGLATWVYFGKSLGGTARFLQPYGGDFLSYLILGMMLNSVLQVVSSSAYQTLAGAYMGSWSSGGARLSMIEYLDMARIPVWVYVAAKLAWSVVQILLRVGIYLLAGLFLFGARLSPEADLLGAGLAFLLGTTACLGIGLISASNIVLLGAWHNVEPLQWSIGLLSGLAAGVYFPPDVLPDWLAKAGKLLPHTYTLRAVRMAMLPEAQGGSPMDLLVLLLMAVLALAIGIPVMKWSRRLSLDRTAL